MADWKPLGHRHPRRPLPRRLLRLLPARVVTSATSLSPTTPPAAISAIGSPATRSACSCGSRIGVAAFARHVAESAATIARNAPAGRTHRWSWRMPHARRHRHPYGFEFIFPTRPAPQGLAQNARSTPTMWARTCGAAVDVDEEDGEEPAARARAAEMFPEPDERRTRTTAPAASRSTIAATAVRATAGSCRRWTSSPTRRRRGRRHRRQRPARVPHRGNARQLRRRCEGRPDQRGPDRHAVRHRARLGDQDPHPHRARQGQQARHRQGRHAEDPHRGGLAHPRPRPADHVARQRPRPRPRRALHPHRGARPRQARARHRGARTRRSRSSRSAASSRAPRSSVRLSKSKLTVALGQSVAGEADRRRPREDAPPADRRLHRLRQVRLHELPSSPASSCTPPPPRSAS